MVNEENKITNKFIKLQMYPKYLNEFVTNKFYSYM